MENQVMNIGVATAFTLLPETKEQQNVFLEILIAEVLDGNIDPLRAEAIIANFESVCKKYRADQRIKDAVLNEAQKYHKDELQNLYNAKFTIKEVGTKYDYQGCGHLKYNALCEYINSLSESKKEMEKELKLHTKNWVFTDIDTGETYEVFPPAKSSKTAVVVEIQ